jgi:alkylation response protein AidB-like acyl-CoA dehydrogenase
MGQWFRRRTVCDGWRLVTGSAAGDAGGRAGFIEFGTSSFYLLSHYYNARRTPIYGGSNEIQRNILAKQVLRMPSR